MAEVGGVLKDDPAPPVLCAGCPAPIHGLGQFQGWSTLSVSGERTGPA